MSLQLIDLIIDDFLYNFQMNIDFDGIKAKAELFVKCPTILAI
jgi:hypothetical protein